MSFHEKLAEIVGAENVLNEPETLSTYSKDESFSHPIRPRCVVKPFNLEEIQGIVRWANDTRTPIIPLSSGTPRFRGGTLPRRGGSVIVDLGRMKKIIRVDRKNRVAMIEPGVTYGELIPELAKEDLAPFLPLSPRQSKSVVASILDREPITMPRYHWETQDPLRTLEIVFGNGDLFRTGSAAGPGTLEEQWEVGKAQSRPSGPSYIDFAKVIQGSQGTMGIVTWGNIACRPLPKIRKAFLIPSEEIDTLKDLAYKLLWKKLGQDFLILNNRDFACLFSETQEQIDVLRRVLPPWILVLSIEGFGVLPEERVEYQETEFKKMVQFFGLEPKTVLAGIRGKEVADVLSGPSKDPYWKLRPKGGCHDIFFLTTLGETPKFIMKMFDLARAHNYPAEDIGVYLQPTVQGVNCHCEFSLSYDPQNRDETEKVKNFDQEAARELANAGAFFSRPYGHWTDFAYGSNIETVNVQRDIKNIFDPTGIMNPGRLCF